MWKRHVSPEEKFAGIALFQRCSRTELRFIQSVTTELAVPTGRVLCSEGDSGQTFYVIIEGVASVRVDGAEVARLGSCCGFGEASVLLPAGRRIASVVATTPMRLLVMSRSEFATLMAHVP